MEDKESLRTIQYSEKKKHKEERWNGIGKRPEKSEIEAEGKNTSRMGGRHKERIFFKKHAQLFTVSMQKYH